MYDLLDDGYPAISEDEAKQRVSNAVDRYRNGTGVYTAYDKKSLPMRWKSIYKVFNICK